MCSHCIIGKGVTFFAQVKVAFAHLEEHFYVPTLSMEKGPQAMLTLLDAAMKAVIPAKYVLFDSRFS